MTSNVENITRSLSIVALLATFGCQTQGGFGTPSNTTLSPDEQEIQRRTKHVAVETLHLKLDKDVTAGHKDNFSGLRTENISFSQRLDSRTFFAYDKRFSNTKETGMNEEDDDTLLKRSHDLLERLNIPTPEIASARVVQENTQVGERDAKTGQLKLESIKPGKRWVRITRQVDGVPVFSSRATVGFMPNREIGFLEVHWPQIPAEVLKKAGGYLHLIEKDWHVPELKGARVESVTAGIVHSPAAATAMDIVPVIRVIYSPLDNHIGKKPVAYVDAEGKPVTMPRVFLQPPREELKTERRSHQG